PGLRERLAVAAEAQSGGVQFAGHVRRRDRCGGRFLPAGDLNPREDRVVINRVAVPNRVGVGKGGGPLFEGVQARRLGLKVGHHDGPDDQTGKAVAAKELSVRMIFFDQDDHVVRPRKSTGGEQNSILQALNHSVAPSASSNPLAPALIVGNVSEMSPQQRRRHSRCGSSRESATWPDGGIPDALLRLVSVRATAPWVRTWQRE